MREKGEDGSGESGINAEVLKGGGKGIQTSPHAASERRSEKGKTGTLGGGNLVCSSSQGRIKDPGGLTLGSVGIRGKSSSESL